MASFNDHASTDQHSASTADEMNQDSSRGRRWRRFGTWGLIGLIVAVAISQVVIWNFVEFSLGDSVKNLITVSQGMLVTLCLLGWWFTCAPVSRRVRLGLGLTVVAALLAWVGSIRRVEFTGDMEPLVHYRWSQTTESILARHRAAVASSPAGEVTLQAAPVPQPEDMPAYRGVNRDGHVSGPPLAQDWQSARELWRQPCGGGYSSMAIVEPLAVTIEQRGTDEAIVAYDTRDGRELWAHRYPARFTEAMGGIGPRATPTIHEDAVYSVGAFGDLFCLDLLSGKVRWHINCLQQFQIPNNHWAMSSSPLIHAGKVIVNLGGLKGNGLAAYTLDNEALVWKSEGLPEPLEPQSASDTGEAAVTAEGESLPGYSSPMLATIHNQLQILNFDGNALRANDPETGRELWSFPYPTGPYVNVAQPIVIEDGRILISASYGMGAALVNVTCDGDNWQAHPVWENKNLKCKFTSPLLVDGFIYGLDEGVMVCLDPQTGERKWKGGRTGLKGRYGHGQILLTNGQIVALTEQGEAVLIQPSPESLQEVTRLRVLPEGKNWNPPALVRGKMYVRNASEMAAFDLRDEHATTASSETTPVDAPIR